jgi:signal transduction histidine kinase/ActR/RegA family two-component response regulator
MDAAVGDMIVVLAAAVILAAYSSNRAYLNLLGLNLDLARRGRELSAANSHLEQEIIRRQTFQEQLHQSQKIEAIGRLTGGIAHDFNNLLTGVIGYLEMAGRYCVEDARLSAMLQSAHRAAQRGATLTRELLSFARKQHLQPSVVDVVETVSSVRKILEQTIPPDIEIFVHHDQEAVCAWVDPIQLELAILNLALNSRDAMPKGGRLTINIHDRRVGQQNEFLTSLPPGEYVVLSVSDAGIGMCPATLARAFEPFFSTKEAGRGSGLGLSMVHGFAAQSGGTVEVTSAVGKGTKVDLWLPRAECSALDHGNQGVVDAPDTELPDARILICDDDDDVRNLVVAALRESGCKVWEASRPSLALELIAVKGSIDLMVVDYAMPEMNGLTLIARATACQPGLKALLMTGYADGLHAAETSSTPVLRKPFKLSDLTTRVNEALKHKSQETRNICATFKVDGVL